MYTGDITSSVSQVNNTKSTIQALLKNRERPTTAKSVSVDSNKDKSTLTNFSIVSDFSNLGNSSKKVEIDGKSLSLVDHVPNNSNLQENL